MSAAGPNPFGDLLKAHWERKNIHQAEFCRRVGKPAGWVQQIREGKKTPPLELMPQWAVVLELRDEERERFLDAACVMHIPAEHRARMLRFINTAPRRAGGA